MVVIEEVSAGGNDFSPDSSRLALGRTDGSILVYELPAGRELKGLKGVPTPACPAFHPNGRQLAVSCSTGVQIYDLMTGHLVGGLAGADGGELHCLAP